MNKQIALSFLLCLVGLTGCAGGSKSQGRDSVVVEQAQAIGQGRSVAQDQTQETKTWAQQAQTSLDSGEVQGKNKPASQDNTTLSSGVGVAKQLPARIHFPFDSVQLTAQDRAQLQTIADYLLLHTKVQLRIEGNTDERGSREYNIALGERRAKSVADILQQKGAEKRQLMLVSYGEEKPVNLGHTQQAYQENRRADLRYAR